MSVPRSREIEASFEDLVESLLPKARATLRRFRLPPEDAEDVLQDTFVTFLRKRDEIYNPEAWLNGTLRKRSLMYWRKRRRSLLTAVDQSILEALAKPEPPDQEGGDLNRDLERALCDIPPRCRRLLELRYRQDCDPKEAAERLGYRSSGIYKILERCLAALTRGLVATGFMGGSECE
ncbi:MAG: sigma-70 family RNA polymerase sigma factor [Thermoanaerobaculia bacterium]|nr:sigma-70 family RNA polymerase sigma factor [Thermoanaerobaculia bacterium]